MEFKTLNFFIDGYYSKKNGQMLAYSKRTGKYFPMPSKKYQAWEKDAVVQTKKLMLDFQKDSDITFPISGYKLVFFRFHYYYGVHSDFNNASQGICDVLQKSKMFENDRTIIPIPFIPTTFIKDKNRGVEVIVALDEIDFIYKNGGIYFIWENS